MNLSLASVNGALSWAITVESHNPTAGSKIQINAQFRMEGKLGTPWRRTQQWHYKGELRILFQAFPKETGGLWLSNYVLRKEKYQARAWQPRWSISEGGEPSGQGNKWCLDINVTEAH